LAILAAPCSAPLMLLVLPLGGWVPASLLLLPSPLLLFPA
jgi:hypothetical protein